MRFTIDEFLLFFEYAESKNFAFAIDWKFAAEDLVYNVKLLLPEFDAEGFEADQVYGDWIEKVIIEGKEYKFNIEDDMRLFRIMFNINLHLKDQNKAFVYYDTQDDDKCFILIDRRFLSDYVEKGFLEI